MAFSQLWCQNVGSEVISGRPPAPPPGNGNGRGRGRGWGRGGKPGAGGGGSSASFAFQMFQSAASTGNQDFTIAGLGWTPTAAIFYGFGQTLDSTSTSVITTMGATDGTSQWCMAHTDLDAQATTNVKRFGSTSHVIAQRNLGSDSLSNSAAFDSFIANGVRLNFDNAGSARYFGVLFIGGDATAAAGTTTLAAASATKTVTVGLEATALLIAHNVSGTASVTGGYGTNGPLGVGFGSWDGSTIRQASTYTHSSNASANSNVSGDSSASIIRDTSVTAFTGTLSAVDATSFDIDCAGEDWSSTTVCYLAINLPTGAAHAELLSTPTSTGDWDITTPGFTPSAMALAFSEDVTLDSAAASAAVFGMGFADGTREGCIAQCAEHNQVTSNSEGQADSALIDVGLTVGANTWDGTFTEWLTDQGVRIGLTATGGTARRWPALFLQ